MQRHSGFTAIELLIALALVALLAMVAAPGFMSALRKSRRAEAIMALAELQHAQERWRSNNAAYTDDLRPGSGLGLPRTTSSGAYGLEVLSVDADGDGYEARASALAQGAQAADSACRMFFVHLKAGSYAYGAQGGDQSAPDYGDARRCWNR